MAAKLPGVIKNVCLNMVHLQQHIDEHKVFDSFLCRRPFDLLCCAKILKSSLTPTEHLVFAHLQWFNSSPCCSDVEMYSKVCEYAVTSLLGVVTSGHAH